MQPLWMHLSPGMQVPAAGWALFGESQAWVAVLGGLLWRFLPRPAVMPECLTFSLPLHAHIYKGM